MRAQWRLQSWCLTLFGTWALGTWAQSLPLVVALDSAAAAAAAAAAARQQDSSLIRSNISRPLIIPLPLGTKPEGVSSGRTASEFYVAGLNGKVVHVSRVTNASTIVADESSRKEYLTAVRYDPQRHCLYVAAAISGRGFIFSLAPNSSTAVQRRLVLQLSRDNGYINDVAIGANSIYWTDSVKPVMYVTPRFYQQGRRPVITTLQLGPGFEGSLPLSEASNGVAEANSSAASAVVIFTHYARSGLYRLRVVNGSVTAGPPTLVLKLPAIDNKRPFPDGILFDPADKAVLWVADNFNNRLLKVVFLGDYATATVACVVMASAIFNTPTNLASSGGSLWAVNARFLQCLFTQPCLQQPYELVGTSLTRLCR